MAAPEAISPSGVEQSLIIAVASVVAMRRDFEPVAVINAVAERRIRGRPQLLRPVEKILTNPQVRGLISLLGLDSRKGLQILNNRFPFALIDQPKCHVSPAGDCVRVGLPPIERRSIQCNSRR